MSKLINLTTGDTIVSQMTLANTFWQRTVGLMGRSSISHDEGIWIQECSSIHTVGMRFSIDVIFVDRDGYILRIVRSVKPNLSQLVCHLAQSVIEIGCAAHLGHDLLVGDQLALESDPSNAS